MRAIRVWFNHWFSSAYHIIKMLKNDSETQCIIIGSNTDPNCVYRAVCDDWVSEPKFETPEQYIDFCLDFCKQYRVDVFFPRRNMLAVGKNISKFDELNIRVLVERDYELLRLLNDKTAAYKLFSEKGIGNVPAFRSVSSVCEFEVAYSEIKTADNRVCIKLANDEGAVSFRVIDNRIEYSLTESIGAKITYDNALKLLSRLDRFPRMLVMLYLSGVEVSTDCLSMPDGNHIVIPRFKSWGRSEEIKYDDDIISICKSFLDTFKLQFPCNVQFKYDESIPYLLEVNTRMSGGIQLSYAASGVNIPNIALNRLLMKDVIPIFERKAQRVSFIETPVVLY